ncbi:unnamed protein product [Candidula unifasciata]|uniref:Heparan-alpha-glucosaminide N-acetyltransferase catalytic domain-containing protein n=1 Tax=Candidula unifasciata TaxID=100452 RepID=A0A8S3Z084_9EUPU|nr:unnamed protein product [Candidula unifasciata]
MPSPVSDYYIKEYNAAAVIVDSKDDGVIRIGLTKPQLNVNTAWLTVNSTLGYEVELWAQTDECYKCNLMLITKIGSHGVQSLLANATHQTDLRLIRANSTADFECRFKMTFREGGDYWIFLDHPAEAQEPSCKLILANDPKIAELPILYVIIGLIGLAFAYAAGKKLYAYIRRTTVHKSDSMEVTSTSDQDGGDVLRMNNGRTEREDNPGETNKGEPEKPKQKQRLKSLDTFRGITLILMIFVNYGGGGYWFFEHAAWNGLNVADLVFPWFVFMMGVSMNFSFRSMFRQGWSVPRIVWKIVWRAAKLFLIGFMLGTHFKTADMEKVRVMGVLQRLALTYLVSALIHYCCTRRSDSHQDTKWAMVRDLVLYVPEWSVNLLLLAVHSSLVYALPVPGCPRGYVGPGGISEGGLYANCTGGATGYIDAVVLGYQHLYGHPTSEVVYQTVQPFDPEGLLATLNSVFLCFLGIQCGRIILIYQGHKQRLLRFLIWAVALGALAALLTKCSRDDGWIPPNKNLWSFSFTLITASFGFVFLSGIYIVTDLFGVWAGQPFIYPGMNSIVIYVCHDIFSNTFPVSFEVDHQHWKLLLRCVWGTSCWVIVAYWLYIKKIFIAL